MTARTTAPKHYLAIPRSGSGPGIVVLHSWWGLNAFFKGLCDRLAEAGFTALAPDLYGGKVATTVDAARKLRAQATASRREPAYKTLMAAVDGLAGHEAVVAPEVALLGFSMGGHWALWLAQRPDLPIAATAVFYTARNGDFARGRSPFAFHFAKHDEWVSAASKRKLKTSLEAAGRSASYFDYPGTSHWFFESDRTEAFNPAAAALAWERTLTFLAKNGRGALLMHRKP